MNTESNNQLIEALRLFVQTLVEEEVERKVAERLGQVQAQAPPLLGIEPHKLYSRADAALLLDTSERSLIRAEEKRGLTRKGSTSRVKYLGADLLKLAKLKSDQ